VIDGRRRKEQRAWDAHVFGARRSPSRSAALDLGRNVFEELGLDFTCWRSAQSMRRCKPSSRQRPRRMCPLRSCATVTPAAARRTNIASFSCGPTNTSHGRATTRRRHHRPPRAIDRPLIHTTPRAWPGRAWFNVENCVSGAAVVALIVLVVLPLISLVWAVCGPGTASDRKFFRSALAAVIFRCPLQLAHARGMDGAPEHRYRRAAGVGRHRTDLPGRQFVKLTATLSYLSPPFLVAIAYVNLFSPRAGVINAFLRHATGTSLFTFNIFSMPGLVLVTVLHTFPSSTCSHRRRFLRSMRATRNRANPGAGKLRTLWSVTFPLVAPRFSRVP